MGLGVLGWEGGGGGGSARDGGGFGLRAQPGPWPTVLVQVFVFWVHRWLTRKST